MMELEPGDIFFCQQNKTLIQKGINFIQGRVGNFNNREGGGKSESSHCGIIINYFGSTFESRLRIGKYELSDYIGKDLRIYRFRRMTAHYGEGYRGIIKHEGQIYPIHRLLLFMVPGLAEKIAPLPKPVCAELCAKFLYLAHMREKPFWGTDVDELEDELKSSPKVDCVFNETLTKENYNV